MKKLQPTTYLAHAWMRSVLLLLLLCGNGWVSAQKIDSLNQRLSANIPDTERVSILIDITRNYRDGNPDSMIAVAYRALRLASRINYYKGIGQAYFQAGVGHSTMNRYDSGDVYYAKALKVFEDHQLWELKAKLMLNIGISYYRQNKLDASLDILRKTRDFAHQQHFYQQEARAWLDIGDVYRDKGSYSDALNAYIAALGIYEQQKDNTGLSEAYRNMGDIYSLLGNFPKARECLKRCLQTFTPGSDVQAIIVNYTSVGSIYGQMEQFTDAIDAYRNALALARSINNTFWIGALLLNIGEGFSGLKQTDSAAWYYAAALKYTETSGDMMAAAYCRRGLGGIALAQGNTSQAIQHLTKAFDVVNSAGVRKEISEVANLLWQAYEKNGDSRNALKFSHIYITSHDSLYNEENLKRIQQMQSDYEVKKKETEIRLLNKDKLLKQEQLDKQRLKVYLLFAVISLLGMLVAMLIVNRRKELQNKKNIIRQRDEIETQANTLQELNTFKDKTFSVLSHDLKGPVASLTGIMSVIDNDDISADEFKELKPEIDRQLSSLGMLLDNLLSWSKSHIQGASSINIRPIQLQQLAADNIGLAKGNAARKNISLSNNVPVSVYALADEGEINVVIRNLLSNAIKFTPAGGQVTIGAHSSAGTVHISVTDTGVGMTSEQLSALFNTNTSSTFGTGGEKGVGLGLLLSREFVTANNGSLHVSSVLGKGTTFTITLPAAQA